MKNIGINKIISLLLLIGVTLQHTGCTTVVGKGDVAPTVGKCTEGEDCVSYCCVNKERVKTWGSKCSLRSTAPEGIPCSCSATSIVGLTYLGGVTCSGTSDINSASNKTNTTPIRDYKHVDYKKWVSGLYNDEYIGNAVIVEGYIMKQITPFSGVAGYRPSSEITLYVLQYSHEQIRQADMKGGTNSFEMLRRMIPISAPKSMRDQIFEMNDQQKVKIYGVVINPTSQSGTIRVKAERIEEINI